MADQTFTNLDFENVKTSLKNYLKGQDRFKDYDFSGSNMNILLDVLAYNTFQNNFYTNMAISEMFLDSAQIKDSVVSHAKELNYLPRSRRSSNTRLRVQFFPVNTPPSITIPRKTKFIARCGSSTYSFWTNQAYTAYPVDGLYIIDELSVYEGRYIEEFYQVAANTNQRFIINNPNVDTESIKVYVRANTDSTLETEYVYKSSIFGTNATTPAFYLQPFSGNRYEIVFGDNVFGKQPINGNVIRVEYRVTVGEEANGIGNIDLETPIEGISSTETVLANTQGGAERETIESIKFYAPKSIQIQERAVTESDYEILLKNQFPEIQAVSAFGGETLNPPQYGRVIIAVDIKDSDGVPEAFKNKYASYLRERSPLAIEPIVVSPKFMFVRVESTVYYDTKRTTLNASDISASARSAVLSFSAQNLNDFNKNIRCSRITTAIDDSNSVILSNNTVISPIIEFNPTLGVRSNFAFTFNNVLRADPPLDLGDDITLHQPAVKSSNFTFRGRTAFFQDDGRGVLKVVTNVGSTGFRFLKNDAGTVNYETGEVVIKDIVINSYTGSAINIIGRTRCGNIFGVKDRIVSIREQDIFTTIVGN